MHELGSMYILAQTRSTVPSLTVGVHSPVPLNDPSLSVQQPSCPPAIPAHTLPPYIAEFQRKIGTYGRRFSHFLRAKRPNLLSRHAQKEFSKFPDFSRGLISLLPPPQCPPYNNPIEAHVRRLEDPHSHQGDAAWAVGPLASR